MRRLRWPWRRATASIASEAPELDPLVRGMAAIRRDWRDHSSTTRT